MDSNSLRIIQFNQNALALPEKMQAAANSLVGNNRFLVTLPAIDAPKKVLLQAAQAAQNGNITSVNSLLNNLGELYKEYASHLFTEKSSFVLASYEISQFIRKAVATFTSRANNINESSLQTISESLTAKLFYLYLREKAVSAEIIHTPDLLVFEQGNLNELLFASRLQQLISKSRAKIFIVLGGSGSTNQQPVTTDQGLVSLLCGKHLHTHEVHIWEDINGRVNRNASQNIRNITVAQLTYENAGGQFGLNDSMLGLAKNANIAIQYVSNHGSRNNSVTRITGNPLTGVMESLRFGENQKKANPWLQN